MESAVTGADQPPCSWIPSDCLGRPQIKLVKIGARLARHTRRLMFQLAEVAVPRALFQGVLDRIGRLCSAPG